MDTVIVAFENPSLSRQLSALVESSGVAHCITCRNGDQVRQTVSRQTCYCAVCSPHLPDGPAEWLFEDLPPYCSLLLVGPQHVLDTCGISDIFRMATPLHRDETLNTIRLLLQFGHRIEKLTRPRRNTADQEIVERAKRLLMEHKGLSEAEAHRSIQKRSMDAGARAVATARQIIQEFGETP